MPTRAAVLLCLLSLCLSAPLCAQAQLHRLDPAAGQPDDDWAQALARDGDWLAVGAPRDDLAGVDDTGSVSLLRWAAGAWSLAQELAPAGLSSGAAFGQAVALQGDVLAVGLPGQSVAGAADQGQVRVYRRVASQWQLEAQLSASDGAAGDVFGSALALDGDALIVGAPGQAFLGAAYVFRSNGASWLEQAKLTAPLGAPLDAFGFAVDLRGDRALVTAPGYSLHVPEQGSAYTYLFNGSAWAFEQQFGPNFGGFSHQFGNAASLADTQLLVGAAFESNQASGDGSAYLFSFDGGSWSETLHLVAPAPTAFAGFGRAVALRGEVAVVGAPGAVAPLSGAAAGAAHVYRLVNAQWTADEVLHADDGALFDRFGTALALDGSQLVAGAPGVDVIGAGYVFSLADPAWTDLGLGLAGTRGVPDLLGDGSLAPSTPVSLTLSDARPNSASCLLVGPSYLGASFKGGVLGPDPVVPVCLPSTGADGALSAHLAWPPGYPSGFSFYAQYWVVDPAGPLGLAASATLQGVTP